MAGFLSAPGARAALESLGYPTAELVPLSAVNALLGENREDALLLTVVVKRAEDFSPEMPDEEVPSGVFEPQSVSERQVKRLTCPYPYEAVTGLPAKSSVTALTHRQLPVGMDLTQKEKEESLLADEFDLAGLSSESTEEQDILKGAGLKKPAFLLEEGRITGAMRGRATHSFLQFADFAAAKQDLETEIARLVSGQYLTESDAALINRYEIGRFLTSSLCARILLAQKQGTLLREYAFIHALPASAASDIPLPEYCREEIVVQGIADCILLSPEGLTLIDYKTDRLQDEADFVARYRSQLAVYADALSLLFADRYENQPPVREIVIYSLYLGREIAVEIEKGL